MIYRFRLYVLGETNRSARAIEQLRTLCAARLGTEVGIDVVDLHADPDRADDARIVATPTLDRLEPGPLVRVIGDLSSEELATVLELPDHPDPRTGG